MDWSNYIGLAIAAAAVIVTFFFSRAQTRIMRQGLKQSLEQNIGDDIATALAQYLQQSDPAASTITPANAKNSPVATALQRYVRDYVGRRLNALQEKTITPPIDALDQRVTVIDQTLAQRDQAQQAVTQAVADLTGRVKRAEEGLRNTHVDIYNQILSDLSKTLSTITSNEHFMQALAEEARAIQANIQDAEARISAQVGRYADDIGNHDRDIAALQTQMEEFRTVVNQDMVRRLLHLIADQLQRAAEG